MIAAFPATTRHQPEREGLLGVEGGRPLGQRQRRHERRPRGGIGVDAAVIVVVADEVSASILLGLAVRCRTNWEEKFMYDIHSGAASASSQDLGKCCYVYILDFIG